jgi:hypothetical protein
MLINRIIHRLIDKMVERAFIRSAHYMPGRNRI